MTLIRFKEYAILRSHSFCSKEDSPTRSRISNTRLAAVVGTSAIFQPYVGAPDWFFICCSAYDVDRGCTTVYTGTQ
jgi:hypothetical protein